MPISVAQFIERLTESGLLSATEIATFQDSLPPDQRPKDVQAMAASLVKAGKLTKYQARQVYSGKTKGLVFGQYVVLDKLGEGGMGVVFRARHRKMDRLVAVKVLAPAAVESPEAVQRFYREVKAAAKLSHPNIVTAHDADEHQGMHYLVIEYVEGMDLAAIVKDRGPMSVPMAVGCILQAARGLQYAHEQGVVHRDIKPANLLMDKKGTVKILDMGLALIAGAESALGGPDRLTTSGQVMGTCDYMAPEQAMDTRAADQRADIYSLGCTLYRLLTGERPFKGETLVQILMAHQQAPIPSLRAARPDVPADLDVVFQKMLAKEPQNRYPSMAQVIAGLEAVTGGKVKATGEETIALHVETGTSQKLTKPRPSTFLSAARGWLKPPKLWLAIGGGVLAIVGLLAIVLTVRTSTGTLVVEIDEQLGKDVQVAVSQGGAKVQLVDAKQAGAYQKRWAEQLGVPVEITNSIGMKLVLIPPGEFTMGSPKELIEEELKANAGDAWSVERLPSEGPQHQVRITKPFYLGVYEVTQGEYERVMGVNPSEFSATGNGKDKVAGQDTRRFPVEWVPWNDCAEFCRKLSALPEEKSAGRSYALPSEAQWEYACRAGNPGRYSFSSDRAGILREEDGALSDYGWSNANAGRMTHGVGGKRPNAYGLYDMHGNVWEWCSDCYDKDYYRRSPQEDPAGPDSGDSRVLRGGSWYFRPDVHRSAGRSGAPSGYRDNSSGFRVCLALPEKPSANGESQISNLKSASEPSPPAVPTAVAPWPADSPVSRPDAPPPAIAPFDAAKAKEHQAAWAKHLGVPVEETNSIGMKLVLIPPGEFMMGSPKELIEVELKVRADDLWYMDHLPSEGPQHRVRITKSFYLGVYEVTQGEYETVMCTNPSDFSAMGKQKDRVAGQDTKRFPVEHVSWNDAVEFCRKLSALPEEKSAGRSYRLPSEAQWEYACRAGNPGRFSFSSGRADISRESEEGELSDYGWYNANAGGMTHAVCGKRPNAYGLYDMYGNVGEWCSDCYDKDYYSRSPLEDPVGPDSGGSRLLRSGSWIYGPFVARSAGRDWNAHDSRYPFYGFRVVCGKKGSGAYIGENGSSGQNSPLTRR